MTIRFIFDVEAQDLHKEGFAYGYVVVESDATNNTIKVLEQGECYSILGAQAAGDWVKENVIPSLTALLPYMQQTVETLSSASLPDEIVLTTEELRNKFFQTYLKWKKEGAEIWSDVNFPVETNFLSAVVKDGNGSRDWDMPFPLKDISTLVNANIKRNEYSNLPDLREHNPLDDSLASAWSLHRFEVEQAQLHKKENSHSIAASIVSLGSPVFTAPSSSSSVDDSSLVAKAGF